MNAFRIPVAAVLCFAWLSVMPAMAEPAPRSFACPVTIPTNAHGYFGNDAISTTLWTLGVVIFAPDGPGFIEEDGSLAMKWPWARRVEGELAVEGHRLDGPAAPLRAELEDQDGLPPKRRKTGFLSSALIFPSPGCWEVTSKQSDTSIR